MNPSPAQIVGLVEKLVEGIWPRSDFDRKAWFESLGLVSGAGWDDPATPDAISHYALRTPLAGGEITSSWNAFNGRFMGVTLQLYSSMETDNPSTRQAFTDIVGELDGLYGEGSNAWRDPVVQACEWHANGRRIVARFFNLRHSSVMLSVDDAGLATTAETATRRFAERTHWNDSAEAASPYRWPLPIQREA